MWGQAIDTAVGLTFIFAVSALFCSALVEAYATWAERRARYLITAIRNMLDASEGSRPGGGRPPLNPDTMNEAVKSPEMPAKATDELARASKQQVSPQAPLPDAVESEQSLTMALFEHPLIRSLQTRKVRPNGDGGVRNPQYIPSSVFARALIGTLQSVGTKAGVPMTAGDVLGSLRTAIEALPPGIAARRALLDMLDQAGTSLETFRASLEDWYDAEMGRISGWYKRWAQAVLLGVGLVVAILANIDTLSVTHTLWVNEPVRNAVVAEASSGSLCSQIADPQKRQTCAEKEIGELASVGVPIGPTAGCGASNIPACFGSSITVSNGFGAFLLKLLGWIITAGAISFGAPFWFDALSKLGSLRSAGPKPAAS